MAYKNLLVYLLLLGYSCWVRGQAHIVAVQRNTDDMAQASPISNQQSHVAQSNQQSNQQSHVAQSNQQSNTGQASPVSSQASHTEQESSVSNQPLQTEQESSVSNQPPQDEGDDSVMYRLQNVTSLDEFIPLLYRNGAQINTDDIISNYTDPSGARHISTGGRMAQPDDCSPRFTTVRLTFPKSNPNIVYFPRCTKIERCGGCCASPHLECVPSYTERESYKVIKAEQPYPGSTHLEWKGEYETVIIDRHVNCRVQCTLTADKCGPKKVFQERQCDCKCRAYERCQPPKVWDPEECECKCAEVLNCCKNGEFCGMVFLKDVCECGIEPMIEHIINANLTQEQIDAYYALLNGTALTSSVTPSATSTATTVTPTTTITLPTTTTTTTTTTTPTATTTSGSINTTTTNANANNQAADPCSTTQCPRTFQRVQNPNGTCSCASTRGRRNAHLP